MIDLRQPLGVVMGMLGYWFRARRFRGDLPANCSSLRPPSGCPCPGVHSLRENFKSSPSPAGRNFSSLNSFARRRITLLATSPPTSLRLSS